MNEIARVEQPQPTPLLILQQAVGAGMSAETLAQLIALKERQDAADAEAGFAEAMAKFQARCPAVEKARNAEKGRAGRQKYASLEDVDEVVRPLLTECGLVVSFTTAQPAVDQLEVVCRVRHGTHAEETKITLPISPIHGANATQSYSGAVTTGKRIALCAALNVVLCDEREVVAEETLTADEVAGIRRTCEGLGFDVQRILNFTQSESLEKVPRRHYGLIVDSLRKVSQARKEGVKS